MNASPNESKPDFDDEFLQVLAKWREEHKIRDDDAVLLLIEMFRIVAAAQSTTSLVPPLGNDKAKVLALNLRNRIIFRSADEADAVQTADFLGKKQVVKRSWGSSVGRRSVNYSEAEEHKIKPHRLRNLRDHECVLVHCEKGFQRLTLPPLEANAEIPKWFSLWR